MKIYSKKQVDLLIDDKLSNIKQECINSVHDELRNMSRNKDQHDYTHIIAIVKDLQLKIDILENQIIQSKIPIPIQTKESKQSRKKLDEAVK